MQKTILFVPGMCPNAGNWDNWVAYFTQRGYNCVVPAWPDQGVAGNISPELGTARLVSMVREIEDAVSALPDKPIVIGRSEGGLLVQLLEHKSTNSRVAQTSAYSFEGDLFKNKASGNAATCKAGLELPPTPYLFMAGGDDDEQPIANELPEGVAAYVCNWIEQAA